MMVQMKGALRSLSLNPELCWVCGRLLPESHLREYSHLPGGQYGTLPFSFVVSDGPFAYGCCRECRPALDVAWPIARIEDWAETAALCMRCGHTDAEAVERGWSTNTVVVRIGLANYAVCHLHKQNLDEARAAAKAVRAL